MCLGSSRHLSEVDMFIQYVRTSLRICAELHHTSGASKNQWKWNFSAIECINIFVRTEQPLSSTVSQPFLFSDTYWSLTPPGVHQLLLHLIIRKLSDVSVALKKQFSCGEHKSCPSGTIKCLPTYFEIVHYAGHGSHWMSWGCWNATPSL